MALVAGGGGGACAPVMVAPPLAFGPQAVPGPQYEAGATAVDAQFEGEGAWDLRAWEKDAGDPPCACIVLGAELRGARWNAEEGHAAVVALGFNGDATSEDGGLPALVSLDGDFIAKAFVKWLSPDSRTRAFGNLPAGVTLGKSRCNEAATVCNVVRLLGLCAANGEEIIAEEGRRCSISLSPSQSRRDVTVPRGVDVNIQLPHRDGSESETITLDPEELVSLLLAHGRRRFAEIEGGPVPDMALAVPSWWGDARRASAAAASSYAGSRLRRIFSKPVCAAVGLFARLALDDQNANDGGSNVEEEAEGRILVLVADADCNSVDVMLFEVCPKDLMAERLKVSWALAVVSATWHTVASSGGPCRGAGGELAVAVKTVFADAGVELASQLSALVLVGDADVDEVVGAAGARFRRTFRAFPSDTPEGLAHLVASESGDKGAVATVVERLPGSVGLAVLPSVVCAMMEEQTAGDSGISDEGAKDVDQSDIDVLFERGESLPVTTSRSFSRQDGGDVCLAMLQRESNDIWRRCQLQPILSDDNPGSSASVSFEVDRNGCLSVSVEEPEVAPTTYGRWFRILMALCFLVLVVSSSSFGLFSSGGRQQVVFRAQLVKYMQKHNPSKLVEIDEWIRKYAGKEQQLMRRLEKKYGSRFPQDTGTEL